AVTNAIPAGTQLVGSVPVTGGVAEVNLSAPFLQDSGHFLAAAAAQVVYTLRQLPDVRDVRLLVEGNPEPVPRGGRAGSVEDFDPGALPGGGGLTIVQNGRLAQADGHPFPGPIGQLTGVLAGASDTSGGAAVVRGGVGGQQLVAASAHASQARALGSAAAFTPPT